MEYLQTSFGRASPPPQTVLPPSRIYQCYTDETSGVGSRDFGKDVLVLLHIVDGILRVRSACRSWAAFGHYIDWCSNLCLRLSMISRLDDVWYELPATGRRARSFLLMTWCRYPHILQVPGRWRGGHSFHLVLLVTPALYQCKENTDGQIRLPSCWGKRFRFTQCGDV